MAAPGHRNHYSGHDCEQDDAGADPKGSAAHAFAHLAGRNETHLAVQPRARQLEAASAESAPACSQPKSDDDKDCHHGKNQVAHGFHLTPP